MSVIQCQITQTIQDRAIVPMADTQEVICNLLITDISCGCSYNGVLCSLLNIVMLSDVSRSRPPSASNNLKIVQNSAVLTMATNWKSYMINQMVPFSMTLNFS